MTRKDFRIGLEFHTASGKWRCTDVGTRVVVAIKLDQDDPRNYAGPPYSVAEEVFDEYDMQGCSLDPRECDGTTLDATSHPAAPFESNVTS
jgi:hypothetical protein